MFFVYSSEKIVKKHRMLCICTHTLFCYGVTCTRREQELSNYLQQKDYVRAVGVAINLDQPFRVFTILSGLLLYTAWDYDSYFTCQMYVCFSGLRSS